MTPAALFSAVVGAFAAAHGSGEPFLEMSHTCGR